MNYIQLLGYEQVIKCSEISDQLSKLKRKHIEAKY